MANSPIRKTLGRDPKVKRPKYEDVEPVKVVFVPREGGEIVCLEAENLYPRRLLLSVEVIIDGDAVGYERPGD